MTRLVALLRAFGPPTLAFLRDHWRGASVAALIVIAVLALRGCVAQEKRAEAAEAAARTDHAQIQAQYDAALATVRKLSADLDAKVDEAQRHGGKTVAVFSGATPKAKVPPQPTPPPPSPSSPPAAKPEPCVLSVGNGFELKMSAVEIRKKDSGHVAFADLSLDADNGLHLSGIAEAPVTLPPLDAVAVPTLPSGWGLGVAVAAGTAGVQYGPAVSLPPIRLFGFELNTTASVTVGAAGAQGLAVATVRRGADL